MSGKLKSRTDKAGKNARRRKAKSKSAANEPAIELRSWTYQQFARRHSVCLQTVYSWVEKGWLQSLKIGRNRRILPEHEDDFLNRFKAA